jgi:hypothetical protein
MNLVRTKREAGSRLAMPVDPFGKPLKPFLFLRTCALTFVLKRSV